MNTLGNTLIHLSGACSGGLITGGIMLRLSVNKWDDNSGAAIIGGLLLFVLTSLFVHVDEDDL